MEPSKHENADRPDRLFGRLLTPAQIAERLVVTRGMIYKLVRTGVLPAVYVGRLPRVAESDLAAYIERQRTHGGQP